MNKVYGTNKRDEVDAMRGEDKVFGLGGNDVIHDTDKAFDDIYKGMQGDDFIFTNAGNDILRGGQGSDYFEAHNYYDDYEVWGGRGKDTLDFQLLMGTQFDIDKHGDLQVIRVYDEDSGDLIQKVNVHDVERIDWYMIG